MPCFKSISFLSIGYSPKIKLILQKNAKILSAGGRHRPQTPVPPAAGGLPPDPHSSNGRGLRLQTHKTAPQCEFLASPLLSVLVCYARILPTSIRTA